MNSTKSVKNQYFKRIFAKSSLKNIKSLKMKINLRIIETSKDLALFLTVHILQNPAIGSKNSELNSTLK